MSKAVIISAALTPAHQLRQMVKLRWGIIIIECLVAAIGWLLDYAVTSWAIVLLVLITHTLTNIVLQRLPRPVASLKPVFLLISAIDLLVLSALLAVSGGASNGFVALLLLPVAVVSVLLPALASYLFAIAAVLAYSVLLWLGDLTVAVSPAFAAEHAMHGAVMRPFSRHMWQMWWAFAISAILISWFISSQAALIREKSTKLNQLQQQQIRQEQALAIATYAANAAHDLASPIQNLVLLTEELQSCATEQPALQEIKQQLQRCQQIVADLRTNASQWREQQPAELLPVIQQSLQSWIVTRPEISLKLNLQGETSGCRIKEAASLSSALFQILDNAADASFANGKPQLDIEVTLLQGRLTLRIIDFGEGLSEQRLAELGQLPQQSESGLGLGQFLANVSVERLGGSISRRNLAQGGMETLIRFEDQAA